MSQHPLPTPAAPLGGCLRVTHSPWGRVWVQEPLMCPACPSVCPTPWLHLPLEISWAQDTSLVLAPQRSRRAQGGTHPSVEGIGPGRVTEPSGGRATTARDSGPLGPRSLCPCVCVCVRRWAAPTCTCMWPPPGSGTSSGVPAAADLPAPGQSESGGPASPAPGPPRPAAGQAGGDQ